MYTKDRILNMFKFHYKKANPDPLPEVSKTKEQKALENILESATRRAEEVIAEKKANNIPLEPMERIIYPPVKPDFKKMKDELTKDNDGIPFWDEPNPVEKPAKVKTVESEASASEDDFEYSKLLDYLPKEGHPILKWMDKLKKLNAENDKKLNLETEIPEVSEEVSEKFAPKKEPKNISELDVNDPKYHKYIKEFLENTKEFEKVLKQLDQAYQDLGKKNVKPEYPGPLAGLPISLPPTPTLETRRQRLREWKKESLKDFKKRAEKEIKEMNKNFKDLNSAYDQDLNRLKKEILNRYDYEEDDLPKYLLETPNIENFKY